jgi:8-oxo-dGTP diphosphatase
LSQAPVSAESPGARATIHVAAGVDTDAYGRVLIAQRHAETHQGGLWEFPGGKLEPGEAVEQGLARELDEELGIQVTASEPLIRLHHDYGDRHILLDVRRVLSYRGSPSGREGQPLEWILPEAMDPAQFPAADRPVIGALCLPSRYLITGSGPRPTDAFAGHLRRVLSATEIRIVQLRAPWLNEDEFTGLARRCADVCHSAGARLILNCAPSVAAEVDCDGLHLSEARLRSLAERPTIDRAPIGASCHDASSLARAADLGLDYALVSPVQRTLSHPDVTALGWTRFAELVETARLPVYALGGVADDDLHTAIAHGAQGVAGIRGYWDASVRRD